MPHVIYTPRLSSSMEATELDGIASEIETSVEDIKDSVLDMKQALQALLEVAQNGVDELDNLWYRTVARSQ